MNDREKNLGLFAVRVTSNKICFSLLTKQQQEEQARKEKNFKDIQEKSYEEKYIGGTVVLEDVDSGEKLDLKDTVIFDTSRTKTIVSTQINGQIGTVKEWINDGDVAINMNIIVNDDGDDYPLARLKEIMKFLAKNKTLYIHNKHINDVLGINRMVVSSWKHTPETWNSSQVIAVDGISDETYKIEEEILKAE
jgi:hypothetical protein